VDSADGPQEVQDVETDDETTEAMLTISVAA